MLIERREFEATYLSGAVVAADLGLADVGPTSVSEVAQRAQQIARVTNVPLLVDADSGFGEAMNVARAAQLFVDAGVAALDLEDQVNEALRPPRRQTGRRTCRGHPSRVRRRRGKS